MLIISLLNETTDNYIMYVYYLSIISECYISMPYYILVILHDILLYNVMLSKCKY